MDYRKVCTVGDLLVRGATVDPDRDAIVFPDERRTYAELLGRAVDLARSLHALGVRRADRVGLLLPNAIAYQELWFATMLLGAVAVPINSRFRSVELGHVVPDAGIRLLVVADPADAVAYGQRVIEALPELREADAGGGVRPLQLEAAPGLDHIVDLAEGGDPAFLPWSAFVEAGSGVAPAVVEERASRVALRDRAAIFYTSGTTSLPKGCDLSHEALVRQGQETAVRMDVRDGDVMLNPLPMFHTGCTQPLYATIERVGTYCSMPTFDADDALRLIREEAVTVMYTAFPPITDAIVDHPERRSALDGVRSIFTTGAPSQLRELEGRLAGTRIVTGFGMTEFAGSVAISDPRDDQDLRLSPGRPLRGAELEIRGLEDDRPVPAGVEGEIVVRGPTGFSGYHENPEATAAALDADGWYRSGDLGIIDEKGLLHFRGRLKDMLKIGGENVAAVEIEAHLQSHPDVAMAQVVGAPDERYGEVAAAFVERVVGSDVGERDLVAHCEGAIASFKVPRYVRFVTEWPMSATKVRKIDLRRRIADEIATGGDR
jgi:fatty-acyl-CoA synthase